MTDRDLIFLCDVFEIKGEGRDQILNGFKNPAIERVAGVIDEFAKSDPIRNFVSRIAQLTPYDTDPQQPGLYFNAAVRLNIIIDEAKALIGGAK